MEEPNGFLRNAFSEILQEFADDNENRFLKRSQVRAIIWEKAEGKCWYCGVQTNPFRDFNIDHIVPRVSGGKRDFENLVPCCSTCNRIKGGHDLETFRTSLAHRQSNYPEFTSRQLTWLTEHGYDLPLPATSEFKFYFEKLPESKSSDGYRSV